VQHVKAQADTATQLAIAADISSPWYPAAAAAERTNVFFLSWLLYDLAHVVTCYPRLGGMDTIAHHLGFIGASLVCGSYRILPFPFAWLTTGELSSIALNIRWFLINSGRGDTAALQLAQVAFALLFFVTRVVLYGAGLAHLAWHRHLLFARVEGAPLAAVPLPLLVVVLLLLCGGYALNMLWMSKIVKMARGGRRAPKKRTS